MCAFRPLLRVSRLAIVTLVFSAAATTQSVHAATLIVTNTADSGPGSLRDTIAATTTGDTIQFDPALNGQTITLTSDSILVENVTIHGPGASQLTVRRQNGTPEFPIFKTSGESVISGLTISNGNPGIVSYGLSTTSGSVLTIANCTITGNSGVSGGGVQCNISWIQPVVNIVNSTISGNSSTDTGGGIYNSGGFYETPVGCKLTITNSSIFGNTASRGGGIYSAGELTVSNSTISSNSANYAGGIENANGWPAMFYMGVLRIINSTVSNNSATIEAGGILTDNYHVTSRNTIAALNTAPTGPDILGLLTSEGFNLVGNNSGATISSPQVTDQIGTAASPIDPLLGPLQNNGGATLTHALLPGSPAIDQGESSGSMTDQRNFMRPVDFPGIANVIGGDGADIGAFESTPAILANLSTRLRVQTGDNTMIGGFIVTGTQPKTVIVRGIGPSLPVPGVLDDPVIEVHGSSGELLAINDNWKDAETRQQIIGNGLAPTNALESALWGIINPGAYTVVVRGTNNGTGIGLFEVYDLDQSGDSKLGNVSTRGFVDAGDNVMIAGMIIIGDVPARALFRAIGSSLTDLGIPNAVQDPILELHDGNGALLGSNDNWRSDQEAELIATGMPPTNDLESAILQDLAPGNYTAIVRGVNNTTGVALVEAYKLD